jgi:hypothetical protein
MPMRSLLCTRSAESNTVVAHDLNGISGTHTIPTLLPDAYVLTQATSGSTTTIPTIMPPYTNTTNGPIDLKCSINTAGVGEMWRAFWNVMVDDSDPSLTPGMMLSNGAVNTGIGTFSGIYRSSLRDPRMNNNTAIPLSGAGPNGYYLDAYNQMLLRAMIAACNTEAMRSGWYKIYNQSDYTLSPAVGRIGTTPGREPGAIVSNTAYQTHIRLAVHNLNNPLGTDFTVYGLQPQPFITEVYAQTDTQTTPQNPNGQAPPGPNPMGYIAIELYNPYPFAIDIGQCALAYLNRTASAAPNLTIRNQYISFASPNNAPSSNVTGSQYTATQIPPQGYLILENYAAAGGKPGANTAVYRPMAMVMSSNNKIPMIGPAVGLPQNVNLAYVPGLEGMFNHEMVLLRPWGFADGAATGGTTPLWTYTTSPTNIDNPIINTTTAADQMVPLDQYDFTGLSAGAGLAQFTAWHYVRCSGTTSNTNWRFVYPGKYTPNITGPRQDGTDVDPQWGAGGQDPWAGTGDSKHAIVFGQNVITPSYQFNGKIVPTIQLNALGWGGPFQLYGKNNGNVYPYGGFARVGDLFEVPFIGAYRVTDTTTQNVIELNSVTMDCAVADANDPAIVNQTGGGAAGGVNYENIGRFCPVGDPINQTYDYQNPLTADTSSYRYQFATRLLDYFTVNGNPSMDFIPNVSPLRMIQPSGAQNLGGMQVLAGSPYAGGLTPLAVPNGPAEAAPATANGPSELVNPTDGRINVNTAPWKVLAAVPLVPNGNDGGTNWQATELLAKNICDFRDGTGLYVGKGHGPFKTLFELNEVPGFQAMTGMPTPPGPKWGDYYGDPDHQNYGAGATYVNVITGDWETQLNSVRRLSNLLTTRSDTFTVYIVVQGWSQAGVPGSARLVAQRRVAYIMDRSEVTPSDRTIHAYAVPSN